MSNFWKASSFTMSIFAVGWMAAACSSDAPGPQTLQEQIQEAGYKKGRGDALSSNIHPLLSLGDGLYAQMYLRLSPAEAGVDQSAGIAFDSLPATSRDALADKYAKSYVEGMMSTSQGKRASFDVQTKHALLRRTHDQGEMYVKALRRDRKVTIEMKRFLKESIGQGDPGVAMSAMKLARECIRQEPHLRDWIRDLLTQSLKQAPEDEAPIWKALAAGV